MKCVCFLCVRESFRHIYILDRISKLRGDAPTLQREECFSVQELTHWINIWDMIVTHLSTCDFTLRLGQIVLLTFLHAERNSLDEKKISNI